MELTVETRYYQIKGTEQLLGSAPGDPEIYTKFIAAKAPDPEAAKEEAEDLPSGEDMQDKITVFRRNGRGEICLPAYVIKGFFKGAADTMKDTIGIRGAKGKLDNLLFVEPRPLIRFWDYKDRLYTEPDGVCERTLRADTMRGPRTALAASEFLDAGWQLCFALTILENSKTAKSKEVSFDVIETALNYGKWKGLGQWRNAGNGTFEWKEIDKETYEKYI